jgi:hypothetical protein
LPLHDVEAARVSIVTSDAPFCETTTDWVLGDMKCRRFAADGMAGITTENVTGDDPDGVGGVLVAALEHEAKSAPLNSAIDIEGFIGRSLSFF